MIYLAAPFSHPDPEVRRDRYERATRYAAKLLRNERHVFSPLTYSVPMAEKYGIDGSWSFWKSFDLDFVGRCDELYVLKLDGWRESVGVTAEIEFAKERGMPISYVEEHD